MNIIQSNIAGANQRYLTIYDANKDFALKTDIPIIPESIVIDAYNMFDWESTTENFVSALFYNTKDPIIKLCVNNESEDSLVITAELGFGAKVGSVNNVVFDADGVAQIVEITPEIGQTQTTITIPAACKGEIFYGCDVTENNFGKSYIIANQGEGGTIIVKLVASDFAKFFNFGDESTVIVFENISVAKSAVTSIVINDDIIPAALADGVNTTISERFITNFINCTFVDFYGLRNVTYFGNGSFASIAANNPATYFTNVIKVGFSFFSEFRGTQFDLTPFSNLQEADLYFISNWNNVLELDLSKLVKLGGSFQMFLENLPQLQSNVSLDFLDNEMTTGFNLVSCLSRLYSVKRIDVSKLATIDLDKFIHGYYWNDRIAFAANSLEEFVIGDYIIPQSQPVSTGTLQRTLAVQEYSPAAINGITITGTRAAVGRLIEVIGDQTPYHYNGYPSFEYNFVWNLISNYTDVNND
ncbi:MAG: hypothetical protein LBS50_08725 [Prevotellaceae bacterium]|jgi:hypothetical protein|nr:hypothetical protein [Prevotellaceae bacterium]